MKSHEFITEDPIKLTPTSVKAKAWIEKVYALYPGTWQNNHVMMWGEGEAQQFAMFELQPSMSKKDAVEVYWFQAYPLRQGVGSRAMKELQRLAHEDGISLTLYPWDKGQVSQAKLMKFYKSHGFKTMQKGGKNMSWEPVTESELPASWTHENGTVWNLEHLGEVEGRDLGAGGMIDVFFGKLPGETDPKKGRYFIRSQRTGNLRPVPSDHKAVRRHYFPGKV